MKICILTTGHQTLDNRIFYKQALSLKKRYEDITLIVPDIQAEHVHQGIRIIGVPRANSLYGRYKLGDIIVDKAIEIQADIYHFHDFELIYKVGRIKKALPRCKLIYDVHEHYPDMMSMSKKVPKLIRPLATCIVDKSELWLARGFDQIITADDAVRERFSKHNPHLDVIYNFSEFETREGHITPKEYDVIYQGGITLERGVFKVVQAIHILRDRWPQIKMVFVGPFDDSQGQEIVAKYIAENNLEDNIIFQGRVSHLEVEDYIRKSRIGVVTLLPLPKYYKNIPIKQFEYMSCGIPVVGSDLPPIKRFLTSHNSGLIVDPTKPKEIAAALDELLSDPDLCQEMGANGIRAVREEYNWGKMESKLLGIYARWGQGDGSSVPLTSLSGTEEPSPCPRLIAKNATALGISGVLAKVIAVVVGIFVTRYLGPGPFGDYSAAYAFVGTIILFSELGMSQHMVQEGSKNERVLPRYFGNTLFFKSLMVILCYILMLIFMFPAGYSTTVKIMIVVLGGAVCFNALNQSVYNYYQAKQQMYIAAGFQFLTTAIIGGLTLLVILTGMGVVAITATHLITYVLISLLLFLALRKKVRPEVEIKAIPLMVKGGLPFGIHRIFYYVFLQLTILVLSLTATNVELGIYSAAYKLVLMLIFLPSLLTSALYPVLYQLGEKDKDKHQYTIEKVFKMLSAVGIGGSVLLFVLAEPLVIWLYAGKFNASIPILMIVAWFLALQCMSYSLGDVLTTTNRQWQRALVQGSGLVILFLLVLILNPYLGIYGAAYALIIVEAYIFLGYYILVRQGVYKIRIWRQLPVILLASLSMAAAAWTLIGLNPLISAALAGVVYCTVLVAFDKDFRRIGGYAWSQALRLIK